jgi:hypothetical protein
MKHIKNSGERIVSEKLIRKMHEITYYEGKIQIIILNNI